MRTPDQPGRPPRSARHEPRRRGDLGSSQPGSGAPRRAPRWPWGARALAAMVLSLAWVMPAIAGGPERCTTYEEKTLGRRQTLCADGTRAVSTWSPTLQRWDTTITTSPRPTCTGQMNPRTRQVEGRCR